MIMVIYNENIRQHTPDFLDIWLAFNSFVSCPTIQPSLYLGLAPEGAQRFLPEHVYAKFGKNGSMIQHESGFCPSPAS